MSREEGPNILNKDTAPGPHVLGEGKISFEDAIAEFSLPKRHLDDARMCFEECPEGFMACVQKALRLDRPSGTLVAMLKRDQHLEPLYAEIDKADPVTGWRFVRGTHGGTYARDPEGQDKLPKGYDVRGYPT